MARYVIWDRKSNIYTPVSPTESGKSFYTPEEWIDMYGWADNPNAIPVISAGVINGAFMGELNEMVALFERQGEDFSACTTNEEKLATIEEFESNPPVIDTDPTAEERIAAALEYQVMASLPDDTTESEVV